MITRLRMRNFRRFREAVTTLQPGANLIEGLNNAGKTSLFYAIEYALFGRVENFKTIRSLIQPGKKSLGVEVVFTGTTGQSYLLQRIHATPAKSKKTLDGHFTLKEVLEDGEKYVLASDFGDTEDTLALKLQELTGITRRLFSLAIHMRQGEIASILNGSRQLDIVLGVTAASMAEDELRQMALELEKESAGLAVLEERLRSIGGELGTIRAEAQTLLGEKQATEAKLASLTAAPAATADLTSRLNAIQDAMDQFDRMRQLADRARGRIADLAEQQAEASKGLTLGEIDQQLKVHDEDRAQRHAKIAEHRVGLETLQAEIHQIVPQVGDLSGRIERRKSLPKGKGAKCEVCGGAIDTKQLNKETAEWKESLEKLNSRLGELQALVADRNRMVQELEQQQQASTANASQLTRQRTQITELAAMVAKRHQEAADALSAEDSALAALRSLAQELLPLAAREGLETTFDADADAAMLVPALRSSLTTLRQIMAERVGRQAAERKALAELCLRIEGQLDSLQKRQVALEREQAGAEVEAQTQRDKAARASCFRSISAAFKALQVSIRSEAATRLSTETLELHRGLSDRDEFESLTIDPNSYAVQVVPRDLGEEVPASLYEGGGHRLLLGLSFRLAVARMVGHRPFVLLDEPTDGLDMPHRELLLKRICDPSFCEQVLLITHDPWDVPMHRVRLKRQERETVIEN